jgi:arylsulfatase A-like enzyme
MRGLRLLLSGSGSLVLTLVILAVLLGLALATTPVRIGALDLALLTLAYAGIATALSALLATGLRGGLPPSVFALAVTGGVLALQWRERTGGPVGALGLVGLSLALGLALLPLARRPALDSSPLFGVPGMIGGAVLATGVLVVGYGARPTFRWQLLMHHKLLGTPTWAVVGPTIEDEQQRLVARMPATASPGSRAEPGPVPASAGPDSPNILFVLVDTLRADGLAAYGGDPSWMPRLNELAAEGLVLDDVIVNASWTRASMATFFTGLLPEEHGARTREHRLADDWTTLAERLQGAGYETVAFVTNHVNVGRETGFAQGFDTFEELPGVPYARAEEVDAQVAGWIAGRPRPSDATRPLFLYLHYMDPHMPYRSGGRTEGGLAGLRQGYQGELRYLDEHLATTIDRVRAALPGPTVLLLTSDHGEEFGEHGDVGHGRTLYREVLWVPAVLHLPGSGWTGRLDARLDSRDLHELLLRLPSGPELDPLAWAEEKARRRRYASQYQVRAAPVTRPGFARTSKRMVQVGGSTLIWSGYGPTHELYDDVADPAQLDNRAGADADGLRVLQRELDGEVRFWCDPEAVDHSPETLELLKALGYG